MSAPVERSGRRRPFSATVYIHFPSGKGLQQGAVSLRSGDYITYDRFNIRLGSEDTGFILCNAIEAIARTAPNRPLRFVLKTSNPSDFAAVRQAVEAEVSARKLDVKYGASLRDNLILRYATQYALESGEWKDMNNNLHSYVFTVGNGEYNFTTILNVSGRRIVWREVQGAGFDPIAANLQAIRDALAGLAMTSRVAVWSNTDTVRSILRRTKGVMLSNEARASVNELSAYRKSREIELNFNVDAHPQLQLLCTQLSLRQLDDFMLKKTRGDEDQSQRGNDA